MNVLFGGMGFKVMRVRIIQDMKSGASKGYVVISKLLPKYVCTEEPGLVITEASPFYLLFLATVLSPLGRFKKPAGCYT